MPVSELLQRMGSFEVAEWISELSMRDEAEKAAMERASQGAPRTFGG